jgi:hypothetical protein
VRQLLTPYRAGTLSDAQTLLIRAHLRDCGACHRQFNNGSTVAVLDWTIPGPTPAVARRPQAFGWALVACLALFVSSLFIYRAYWQVPPGVRAEVQSVDGSAYLISNEGNRRLSPGDRLTEGEQLRTSGGAHAVLRLADGSTVEVNERSVLAVDARGRNMTVALDNGGVIVQAAKRTQGHLYVKTPDCRVAVTGTVFSVNSGIKGSRVAVLEGVVHVEHGGTDSLLHGGEQIATNDTLSPEPVDQQIAWSHDRQKYLVLLAQFALLQQKLDQIPSSPLRYTSDLLDRVPASTLLYISIPNLGDFLSQANTIFQDQLKQSPALQQWWSNGHEANTAELDTLIEKLHQMSGYFGDEVVVVGLNQSGPKQSNTPGFAIITDVEKTGLAEFLKSEFPSSSSTPPLIVFDEQSLASAVAPEKERGGYALVRPREAIFSNSITTLKQVDAQLNAGNSGFANGAIGQQIKAAYGRGAGVILAADLHTMFNSSFELRNANERIDNSGLEQVQYLIAEHREVNGLPENHLNLQFSGTRQNVASWLGAPGPMGSLEFLTPNASVAVAALSKDPKAIADDIMTMAVPDEDTRNDKWDEAEQKLQIDIRDDLAANLGGEFLFSLDGPVLPTPAWKAVIEVRDSQALESALERMTASIRSRAQGKNSHSFLIESSEAGDQRFYSVRDVASGAVFLHYTFAGGYMIVAPERAILMEALHARASGDSLAYSSAFKALLPVDENDNYSAVAYQNLAPVLTPMLAHVSAESGAALRKIAADSRPTAVLAWGKDARIEAASNSQLFGFDFLALAASLRSGNRGPGNNQLITSVRD